MITLVLEASTYAGSAALFDGSQVLTERSVAMRGKEHEALMAAVGELLGSANLKASQLDRVVCGAGPGSFTSLRIAAAIAKGIALSCSVPLVPVSSLALMVGALPARGAGRYLAVLDAMRGDSYVQEFDVDSGDRVSVAGAQFVVPTQTVDDFARERGSIAVGPARSGAEHAQPHARGIAGITNLIDETPAADLAGWEPLYGRQAEAQVKWEADHGRALEAM